MKRPAFQFYPADWRKDAALQSCSISAQGLWINILCIAHECDPYGHLTVNGRPMTDAQIGRLVGLSQKECERFIAELQDAGVCDKTSEGAIFSRRMVRDEDLRNRRANGGQEGAEHGSKGAEHGIKGGRPKKETGDKKPPLNPPPSSSSSSSSSKGIPPPDGVSPSVWTDFLKQRKTKKAPVTETAISGIRKEAERAGLSLESALAMCCKRGWVGFEAAWVKDQERETSTIWHESAAGVTKRAAELGLPPQDEVMEPFPKFKARVMAADRQGVTA